VPWAFYSGDLVETDVIPEKKAGVENLLSAMSEWSGLVWREDWSSASVLNHTIVTDPTIRQPGFDLPRHTWSLMNRFQTGQDPCRANLHIWGLTQSVIVACDRPWTTLSTRAHWQNSNADRSGWRRSHVAGIYSDCSTRGIIIVNNCLQWIAALITVCWWWTVCCASRETLTQVASPLLTIVCMYVCIFCSVL